MNMPSKIYKKISTLFIILLISISMSVSAVTGFVMNFDGTTEIEGAPGNGETLTTTIIDSSIDPETNEIQSNGDYDVIFSTLLAEDDGRIVEFEVDGIKADQAGTIDIDITDISIPGFSTIDLTFTTPTMDTAVTTSTTTIDVTFSEDIEPTTVLKTDFLVDGVEPDNVLVTDNVVQLIVTEFSTSALPVVTLVDGEGVSDLVGNELIGASTTVTATDGVAPTILAATTGHIPIIGFSTETMKLVVKFSEDVTSVDEDDFAVDVEGVDYGINSVSIDDISGDGNLDENFVTITLLNELPTGSTPTVTYDQTASGGIKDSSDNLVLSQSVVANDGLKPNVVISTEESDPTRNTPFEIKITFSEEVSGFIETEIVVDNGDISNFASTDSIDQNEYTADITPLLDGSITVDIAADVATDLSGNNYGNTVADQFTITFDSTPPEFTSITVDGDGIYKGGETITITADLEETGLTVSAEVNVLDDALSALILSDDDNDGVYTVTTGALDELTLNEGTHDISLTAVDAAQNSRSSSVEVTLDITDPTVTIGSVTSPTNENPIGITITFDEEIENFDVTDISVDGGVASNLLTSDNIAFTADITPDEDGDITVDIAVGAAQDIAGNDNEAATQLTFTYDGTDPEVETYVLNVDGDDQNSFSPNDDLVKDTIDIDVKFTEAVEAEINILDDQGVSVRALYDSASVTDPVAKNWEGKDGNRDLVDDGVYTVEIVMTDLAGNSVTDTSNTIIVDTENPTYTDLANLGDIVFNAQNTWTVTAHDESSGILNYQFSHDSSGDVVADPENSVEAAPLELDISIQANAVVAHRTNCASFIIEDVAGNSVLTDDSCYDVTNSNPVIAEIPTQTFDEDTDTTITLTDFVTDHDLDTITYSTTSTGTDVVVDITNDVMTLSSVENFNGAATFDLVVKDDFAGISAQEISVDVAAVNDAPVIDGDSIVVQEMDEDSNVAPLLELSLFTTDVETTDSQLLTYEVVDTNAEEVECGISGSAPYYIDFTSAENFNGETSCTVKANDGEADSNIVTLSISVAAVNDAPEITSTAATSANEDENYVYSVIVEDVDGDDITYELTTYPEGMEINGNGVIVWKPTDQQLGNHQVVVEVSDDTETAEQSYTLNVGEVNDVPTTPNLIGPDEGAIFSNFGGVEVELSWEASEDVEDDTITYRIFNAEDLNDGSLDDAVAIAETTELTYTITNLDKDKTYFWAIQATDGTDDSAFTEIRSYEVIDNFPPVINSFLPAVSSVTIEEEGSETFSVVTEDPEDGTLTIRWYLDDGTNRELVASEGESFKYEPGLDDEGDYTLEVVVADVPQDEVSNSWEIEVTNKNQAPTFNVLPASEATEDIFISVDVEAEDPDGDTLTYTVGKPLTITKINNNKATVEWTPTNDYTGVQTFQVTVSDGEFITTQTLTFNVQEVNDAPEITSSSPENENIFLSTSGIQSSLDFSIVVTDIDSTPTISWQLDEDEVSTENSYEVKDLAVGTYVLKAVVTDIDEIVEEVWDIEVTDVPKSSQYQSDLFDQEDVSAVTNVNIENPSIGGVDFGDSVLDFSDIADIDRVLIIKEGFISLDSDNFPNLKDKPATITVNNLPYKEHPVIYYNADFDTEGTSECSDTVCSNIQYNSDTGVLTFDVTGFSTFNVVDNPANDIPRIVSTAPENAVVNEEFEYIVEVEDFDDTTHTYTLVGPEGMEISNAGIVTWIPEEEGKFIDVIVTATDDTGDSDSQNFDLDVGRGSPLRIKNIEIKINNKNKRNVNKNNTKISRDVEPGDIIEFKIEALNGYTSEEKIRLEDIEAKVTLIGIDDGEDIEEDSKDVDISPERTKKLTTEFKIPLIVDEGDYNVLIELEGGDEDGNSLELDWNLELEVDKKEHEVVIHSETLNPEKLACGRDVTIETRLLNRGNDNEEVMLNILNSDLELNMDTEVFELPENEFLNKKMKFTVGDNVGPGVYPIVLSTSSKGDNDRKEIELTVESCEQNKEVKVIVTKPEVKKPKVEVKTPEVKKPEVKKPEVRVKKNVNETGYQIFLLVSISLIFMIIIGVVASLILNGRD